MPRLAVGLLLVIAASAAAGGAEPPAGRYAFAPVPAGALRLDTETGEVSLCVGGDKAPACTRVSENVRLTIGERAKLEAKLAELENRVAGLEARERDAATPSAGTQAMGRVEILAAKMMRHFVRAVQAVKRDFTGSEL